MRSSSPRSRTPLGDAGVADRRANGAQQDRVKPAQLLQRGIVQHEAVTQVARRA